MQTILCFKIPLYKPSDHMKYAKMDYWNALYVNFGAWLKSISAIYLWVCIFSNDKMLWIWNTVSNKNAELQNPYFVNKFYSRNNWQKLNNIPVVLNLLVLVTSFTFHNLVLLHNMPKAINECHFCFYVAYFLCDSLLNIYSFLYY